MNNNWMMDRNERLVRRTGLIIALVAWFVLIALAAYKVPLFHNQLDGVIVGVSEIHDETGSELIAAVQLDTGVQVLVALPRELLKSQSNNVKINEARTLFGRKSYRIITPSQ
ncbi:MAG: hypothetical protein JSW45_03045 [Thiotrichales bacterium]|nr:MAG: hypothetical protein JSW45_03045 [Thiotrichales bacterium]